MIANRLYHSPAFGHAQRQGLLHINIFAGFARLDRLQRVPMVRRANDRCVQILHLEQLPVILKLFRRAAALSGGEIPVALRKIANRNDLRIGMFQKSIQDLVAPVADADKPESYTLVGAGRACRAQGSAGPR